MPQFCSSWRLLLTLERAMPRVAAIFSAGSGRGERNSRAWIWATVRLIPQRVPISPQWRMNFWATGESAFLFIRYFCLNRNYRKIDIRQANSHRVEVKRPPDGTVAIPPG